MSYLDPNSINGDNSYNNNEEEDVSSNIEYQIQQQMEFGNYNNDNHNNNQYSTTTSVVPDLLNLCPGAAASLLPLPTSNLPFTDASHKGIVGGEISMDSGAIGSTILMNDPLFHLNLPPPQPLSLGDLFQALPTPGGYGFSGARGCSLFGSSGGAAGGGGDHGEVSVDGLYQVGGGDGLHHFDNNGVLEFSRDMVSIGDGGKVTKHYTTERHRRVQMNDKFKALRSLVPSPTKEDRASVVGDAIDYIKELRRTVNELKLLVEKKRCGRREGFKRQKTEDTATGDVESSHDLNPLGDPDQSYGALRSSWLQRKSKDTEVDVRIIDDEVTVKLVQRKKINCLLFVSKVLDELQLDLHHVAGGVIGEYYSFMFNTKICEGSSVYASAIANKLIEVVDNQYASAPPSNCY